MKRLLLSAAVVFSAVLYLFALILIRGLMLAQKNEQKNQGGDDALL